MSTVLQHVQRRGSLGILIILILISCQEREPDTEARTRAQREWEQHQKVIEGAIAGKFSAEDFEEAAEFFTRLTGLPAQLSFSYVGALPTEDTERDLELWQRWYDQNKHRIYWDEATDSVKSE